MTDPGRVRVVASTATCLDPATASSLGITLVPLYVIAARRARRDIFEISPAAVYGLLRAGAAVTTSSPSVGDYQVAFEAGPGPVLCLTEAASLSSINRTASMAAELSGVPVSVVDSGTAAGGLRLLALAAARLSAEGLGLQALTGRLRRLASSVDLAGMLESVSFLARRGRIPGIAGWGGSMLKVRPVIRMWKGRGSLVALVRRPPAGVRRMHAMVLGEAEHRAAGQRGERLHATVFQAGARSLAGELVERLRADLPEADLSCSEMTSAMAVHTGPGVVGYALYVEPLDTPAEDQAGRGWRRD